MARPCTVCKHPHCDEINLRLINRVPLTRLVRETGLSLGALHRHSRHITAPDEPEVASAVLARVESLIMDCKRIALKAESAKAWSGAASALREIGRNLELLAKLKGELEPQKIKFEVLNQVNLNQQVNLDVHASETADVKIAMLVAEITRGFDSGEIERLKQLAGTAETAIVQP